jgi:hypothetical protein
VNDLKLTHFLVTRFSVRLPIWTKKSVRDGLFEPARLERRLQLFESICVPSVRAQIRQDFRWIIIYDSALPSAYRRRLALAVADLPNAVLYEHGDPSKWPEGWLDDYAGPDDDYVLTTVLDDDDALHRDYVQVLRREVGAADLKGKIVMAFGCRLAFQWSPEGMLERGLEGLSLFNRPFPQASGFSLAVKWPECRATCLRADHAMDYFSFNVEACPQLGRAVVREWVRWAPGPAIKVPALLLGLVFRRLVRRRFDEVWSPALQIGVDGRAANLGFRWIGEDDTCLALVTEHDVNLERFKRQRARRIREIPRRLRPRTDAGEFVAEFGLSREELAPRRS